MASSIMSTLQSNLGDVHAGVAVANKAGNTDAIRIMLREQKRECSELHANPIFREFRDEQKKSLLTAGQQQGTREQPPVIDDLEAEGQTRLFDVIKRAAAERESLPAGVWANFGKPYACLGEPLQMDSRAAALLPKLNRDELSSSQGFRRTSHQKRPGSQQLGSAGELAAVRQAYKVPAGGEKQDGSSRELGMSSKDTDAETAKLLKHKTVAKFTTIDRLEASFPAAAIRQADARSKAAKTGPNKFFSRKAAAADYRDAAASYGKHTIKTVELPCHALIQQHQAAATAAAEHAAGALAAATTAAAGIDTLGDRKSIFITQRAATGGAGVTSIVPDAAGNQYHSSSSGNVTARSNMSRGSSPARGNSPHRLALGGAAPVGLSSAGNLGSKPGSPDKLAAKRQSMAATIGHTRGAAAARCTMSLQDTSIDLSTVTNTTGSHLLDYSALGSAAEVDVAAGGLITGQKPEFEALTELTMQAPGEVNPVTGWHNEFVKARHAGYTALQESLWQRSHDRAVARSDPAGRAALNKSLMQHLDTSHGKLAPGWIPGTTVESPFATGKQSKAATAAAAGAADVQGPPGTRTIKQSEVDLLEHFYDALCGLVEKQRISDPLSLMVVHKVKALLEGGTFLQPPLLQQVINQIADFAKSCGLVRYNRFALPLLTFIRKCVGVNPVELQAMATAAGISEVLYEQQQQQQLGSAAAAGLRVVVDASDSSQGSAAAAALGSVPASPSRMSPKRCNSKLLGAEASNAAFRRNSSTVAAESSSASMRRDSKAGTAAAAAADLGVSPSVIRRNSRLESAALRDSPVPPIPIDAAMAAATADITEAIHSAPQSQRAAAAAAASGDGQSIRVRVPGVAGHVEALQQHAAPAAAAAAAAAGVPRIDLQSASIWLAGHSSSAAAAAGAVGRSVASAAAAEDQPLPDLGEDDDGKPLSRRAKNVEGMLSWRSSATSGGQATATDGGNRQETTEGDA